MNLNINIKDIDFKSIKLPKFKSSKRIITIIIAIIGLLTFYWLYTNKIPELKKERDTIVEQNIPLTSTEKELNKLYNDMTYYMSETERLTKETDKMLSEFPTFMNLEDKILYADNLQKTDFSEYNISDFSYGQSELVSGAGNTEENSTSGEATDTSETSGGLQLYSVSFSGKYTDLGYSQVKSLIDYGLTSKQRFVLDNITISFNEESGYLSGDISFKTFFVPGQEKQYAFGTDSTGNSIINSYDGGNRQGNLFGTR